MPTPREHVLSNFRPSPQQRQQGSGAGRPMLPWKKKYHWLVIAAELLIQDQAGGRDNLLLHRDWSHKWGITSGWLKRRVERMFPGITEHLNSVWFGSTDWEKNLLNRVYKMFYNGTSARGYKHDPQSRASFSKEHWMSWPSQHRIREETVLEMVQKDGRSKLWSEWL